MKSKLIYVLLRKPCLMEDEGRYHYIGQRGTLGEIRKLRERLDGDYFKKCDYMICKEVR